MNTLMEHWPTSLPDYKWPDHFASQGMAAVRSALGGVFHIAHFFGRVAGVVLQQVIGYEAPPTLVIRTDGIGDALLFEPALESLARTVSPSEIHLWAPRPTCQLFAECPTITRRVVIPRGCKEGNLRYFKSIYWRARLGFELGLHRFEKVIYPVQSPEPLGNWLFSSARTEERWVNSGDTDNQFDTQQQRTHEQATRILESRPGNGHELQRNEYLSDQWAEEQRLRRPRVHLSAAAATAAHKLVSAWRRAAERMDATDLVGVVAGSASRTKHYPADQWAEALKSLWDEHRAVGVLLGGPDDRGDMDELAGLLKDVPHFRMLRPVSLLTMAAITRRLDGMLAVDTGLAHVAMSMRVPTVVIVTGGHPNRFFPWPGNHHQVVLNVSMPCDGCKNRCHLSEPLCITRIRPQDIVAAYAKLRVRQTSIKPFVVPAVETPRKKKKVG